MIADDIQASALFRDSAPLLEDRAALAAELARTGCLYLRGVIDPEPIRVARREVMAVLGRLGVVAEGAREPVWTGRVIPGVGEFGLLDRSEFARERVWQRLVESASVRSAIERAVGEPVRFLPIPEFRSAAPGDATVVHQDGHTNQGFDLHTAWFPLMPIGAELGGLAIAMGLHDGGFLPVRDDLPYIEPDTLSGAQWHRADYAPGDLVIFSETAVHCGLRNRSADRLRLSIDVRFQPRSAPAAVLGRVLEVSPDALTVLDDGHPVTLAIAPDTYIRAQLGNRIPPPAIPESELRPGVTVMASQKDGTAVMIRVGTLRGEGPCQSLL